MKYYLVYALDSKGALTKIKGFTKDKDKAKAQCFDTNCAISEIKNLDEEVFTENPHQPLDQLHISL